MTVAAYPRPSYHAAVTSEAVYLRPLLCAGDHPRGLPLSGGPAKFAEIELRRRGHPPEVLPAAAIPDLLADGQARLDRLTSPRLPVAGLAFDRPLVMGVVNVTPDSFSDGGQLASVAAAVAHALELVEAGADLLDIGGESTRPGAEPVPEPEERARVIPVVEGLVAAGCPVPISVDTRKAAIACAALGAGARIFNDVSALTHDPGSAAVAARAPAVCLMHAQGDPKTMQDAPRYDDVLLDVYDFLAHRISAAEAAGVDRRRILVDPGIGFGKTLAHNLALLRGLALFQGLGCPVLVGVSRKRFIGTLSGVAVAAERVAGSIAAGLHGLAQGAQILRVHDVRETVEAVRVFSALQAPHGTGEEPEATARKAMR
ncbi:MAG: dihydropteroate synthase [Pikeienuella sp.]